MKKISDIDSMNHTINTISECAEVSCDGFVGFQVRDCENRTNSSLSSQARRIPQIRARGKRGGFGMMFAIIITILVATLGVLAIRFSTQTLNTTTNEYIAIQLDLYLNSTTELAILYVQRNGFVCDTKTCAVIDGYISYGANKEYGFKYRMTPLDNYNENADIYYGKDIYGNCDDIMAAQNGKRCFREEIKNTFILDISGSVTNPITNQTLRVTKRQIIKP